MVIGRLRDEEGEGPVNSSLMLRCGRTAVATTLLVGMSACGGGDGSNSEQAGGQVAADAGSATSAPVAVGSGVEVVAKDIAFAPSELEVGATPTKITLRNEGAIAHTLVIEGAPKFEKLEVLTNGASDFAVLDVAPGTYNAYCDQPGHRAAGMELKLNVS